MKSKNKIKTRITLATIAIVAITLFNKKDSFSQLLNSNNEVKEQVNIQKSTINKSFFKYTEQVFYFGSKEENIWCVNKSNTDDKHIFIDVYNVQTKDLIKTIDLPELINVSQHDIAKWGDNLWLSDEVNEKFAMINSKDFSVINDPKQLNTIYSNLPDTVFSVNRTDKLSVILTLQNGNQIHFNPVLQVFSKGANNYKRKVSNLTLDDFYFRVKNESDNHANILRYNKGNLLATSTKTFIKPHMLYKGEEFVLLNHKKSLSSKSEKLLSLLDKNCEVLWTINDPNIKSTSAVEVLFLSDKKLVITYGFRSAKKIISIETLTGKINWEL